MEGLGFVGALLLIAGAVVGLMVYEGLLRLCGLGRLSAEGAAETAQRRERFGSAEEGKHTQAGMSSSRMRKRFNAKGSTHTRLTKPLELLKAVAHQVDRVLPLGRADSEAYRTLLARAGWDIEPVTWRGLRIVVAAGGGILTGVMVLSGGQLAPPQACAFIAVTAVAGWTVPRLVLERSVVKRRRTLEAQLPDAMELLGITIAAGSPVEQSFREVAENLDKPLSYEFELVDREVNLLGHSREQALENLAKRCASRDVSSFVAQVAQAVSQGSSIAEGLSSQATLARETAQAATLERIRKMPLKLDLVLSFCFLPPTVALVVVPTVVDLLAFLNDTLQ